MSTDDTTFGDLPGAAAWMGVQVAALAAAVLRVPLSARYPEPAEQLALELMLVVQTVSAAALAPTLLRRWRGWLVATGMALPMLYLAGVLSATPAAPLAFSGGLMAAWLAGLAVWMEAVPRPGWRMTVSAAGLGLSGGGALLWYVRAEFAQPAGLGERFLLAEATPAVAAILQAGQDRPHLAGWVLLAVVLLLGLTVRRVWGRASL